MNNINSVDEALEALSPFTTDTKNTLNSAIFTLDGIKDGACVVFTIRKAANSYFH